MYYARECLTLSVSVYVFIYTGTHHIVIQILSVSVIFRQSAKMKIVNGENFSQKYYTELPTAFMDFNETLHSDSLRCHKHSQVKGQDQDQLTLT